MEDVANPQGNNSEDGGDYFYKYMQQPNDLQLLVNDHIFLTKLSLKRLTQLMKVLVPSLQNIQPIYKCDYA